MRKEPKRNRDSGDDVLYDHELRLTKNEDDITWIKWLLVVLVSLAAIGMTHSVVGLP